MTGLLRYVYVYNLKNDIKFKMKETAYFWSLNMRTIPTLYTV